MTAKTQKTRKRASSPKGAPGAWSDGTNPDRPANRKVAPKKTAAKRANLPARVPGPKPGADEAAGRARDTAALRKLQPMAKVINTRLEQAEKADQKAEDHRLAAALQLAEAKAYCEDHKVNFKTWAEKNVDDLREGRKTFQTVRKLAAIGSQPDPQKALQDTRKRNKAANKKLRDSRAAPAKQIEGPAAGKPKPKSPFAQAQEVLDELGDETEVKVLQSRASHHGLVVMSEAAVAKDREEIKAAADRVREAEKQARKVAPQGISALKKGFGALSADGKLKFAEWVVEQARDLDPDAMPDMPDFLKRSGGKRPETVDGKG